VAWPTRGSPQDDTYWHYVLARYGAHPNIVLDVSKEAGAYGVGLAYAQVLALSSRDSDDVIIAWQC
jgi:hypothetical protein